MNKPKRAEKFVNSVDWIFAKTYAKFAPHEYIVKKYLPEEKHEDFMWLARLINSEGYEVEFKGKMYTCYDIGDKKYWTMDEDVEKTDLINRADK